MSNIEELMQHHTYLTYDDVLLLPNYSEIIPADVETGGELTKDLTLKIPIFSAPMDTVTEENMAFALGECGGIGIIHRNLSIEEQTSQIKAILQKGVKVAAAVGVGQDLAERVERLVAVGVTSLCLDSAHGHSKNVIEAIRFIKKRAPQLSLIAGNIATYDGAKALFMAGADVVKVGMGPGSICTTRIMSGMGVPQLSALADAARAAKEFSSSLIADGGIKTSGDIVKALAAGASAVMLGSLLAGTDEAAGDVVEKGANKYKAYRGMGSLKSMVRGSAARYGQSCEASASRLVPEGVEGLVPCTGPLRDYLGQLMGGVRAGFAYLGAKNLSELQKKALFIRISSAGMVESRPHSILHQDL